MSAPPSLEKLLAALERLPGIGPRSAGRIAHHLLRIPEARALELADAIRDARERIRPCGRCRAPSERDPCSLCADASRDASTLLVVETARDLYAIEQTGRYRGLYYVLGGRLSPLEGVTPKDLHLGGLVARVADGTVREACVATNPDLEGDGTARALERALAGKGVRVTRLARGLPAGGQIEYQNSAVLSEAFERRTPVGEPPSTTERER